MSDTVRFIFSLLCLFVAFCLIRDKTASRIRNSKFWLLGFIAYIFLLANGAYAVSVILGLTGLKDETLILVLVSIVTFATLFALVRILYKIRITSR